MTNTNNKNETNDEQQATKTDNEDRQQRQTTKLTQQRHKDKKSQVAGECYTAVEVGQKLRLRQLLVRAYAHANRYFPSNTIAPL